MMEADAHANDSKKQALLGAIPARTGAPRTYAEFEVRPKVLENGGGVSIRLDAQKSKNEGPQIAARREEFVRGLEGMINAVFEKQGIGNAAGEMRDDVLSVRFVNRKGFDDLRTSRDAQGDGVSVFGNSVIYSDCTFIVNTDAKTSPYELASAAAFYAWKKFPNEYGLESKAPMFDTGILPAYVFPRIFAKSYGAPEAMLSGDENHLVLFAISAALGPDRLVRNFLQGETGDTKTRFDAKFGNGAFARLAAPPAGSSAGAELLRILNGKPGLKDEITKAAAEAGYRLGFGGR
jgi:hypothetical protein